MEQKPKKYYLIPMIIGICMFVAGLTLLILALTSHVSDMGDDGWFAAASAKSGKLIGGIMLMFFGVFVSVGISNVVYALDPVVKAKRIKRLTEQNQAATKAMFKSGQQTKKCLYCGAEFDADKFECPHCGSKQTK